MSSIFDDLERQTELKSATRSLLLSIIDRMTLSEQLRLLGRLQQLGYEAE